MMMQELERLKKDLKENKELQAKWTEALKTAVENGAKSEGEAMAEAAQALGYSIKAADAEKSNAEGQALSADELEQVAGGYTDECWADYSCEYVLHSPDGWARMKKNMEEHPISH